MTLTLTLHPSERYAGVILDAQGRVQHHLVLLAAEPANPLSWKDASAWADSVGGVLPTRKEQALLFANCREQFTADWYWSGEKSSASSAWCQDFHLGSQYDTGKSTELRALAVRRVPVHPAAGEPTDTQMLDWMLAAQAQVVSVLGGADGAHYYVRHISATEPHVEACGPDAATPRDAVRVAMKGDGQ